MAIEYRIFIGYVQDKELKIHLTQSSSWRKAKDIHLMELTETSWQDKDYIGLFIPSLSNSMQIKEKEQEVKTQLQLYCPKFNLDKHSIYLFAQLFIS